MPGNLLVAAPTLVMPFTLCTAFTEARLFEVLVNTYHDGTPERGSIQDGVDVPVSMRRWTMSKRLPASTLIALRSFYESLNGGVDPFYWYNPQEAAPGYPVGLELRSDGREYLWAPHGGVYQSELDRDDRYCARSYEPCAFGSGLIVVSRSSNRVNRVRKSAAIPTSIRFSLALGSPEF